MAYRFKWEHSNHYAECHEGWVEREDPEGWWNAFMNWTTNMETAGSRHLGTFATKREAMDRVETEFAQSPGPPCRVLMQDGHRVIEINAARQELPAPETPAES